MSVTNPIPEYEIIAPKEAIISWKHDLITKQIVEILSAEKINSALRMSDGETLGENAEQKTARAVGYIDGLKFAENLIALEFVVGDKEDGEE